MVEDTTIKSPTVTSSSSSIAAKLKSSYQSLVHEAATLFPKMDQKLLLNVLQFETTYDDWEGSVMLKVVYPANKVDLESKRIGYTKGTNVFHPWKKVELLDSKQYACILKSLRNY